MDINCIIVDNFLDNPDIVRESVLKLDFYDEGPYPGLRSDRAEKDYEAYVQQKFEDILNLKITEWKQDSLRFQIVLEGQDSWVHTDESTWAAILYLTPDAPIDAGTGMYRKSGDDWELVTGVGNVYNRLVIFKGKLWHRSILPGFGNSKETGRLTQVFFFETEKAE